MARAASLCPNAMSPKISTPAMYVLGIAVCGIEIPMALFTVLGNCVTIYVICKHQTLQRNHNYMLVAVAATDLITGLVTQPLSVTLILQELTQDVNCDLKEVQAAFKLLGNLTSLLTLMLLSLERILAVNYPFWYSTLVTPKRLLCLVIGVWVFALLLVLSPYFATVAYRTRMRIGMVFQMISFAIIVMFALFMYRTARRHENQITAQNEISAQNQIATQNHMVVHGGGQQNQQRERKAFKTSAVILGALVLCQIPMFISSFLFRIKVFDEQAFAVALWPAGTLMHLNATLNFCIYGWRNSDIQKKIMELFRNGQNNEQAFSCAASPSSRTHTSRATSSL